MEKKGSFEETIKELEKIATELENGDLSLEDSVSKFEEGMKLSKQCNDLLENAEKELLFVKRWRRNKRRKFCTRRGIEDAGKF